MVSITQNVYMVMLLLHERIAHYVTNGNDNAVSRDRCDPTIMFHHNAAVIDFHSLGFRMDRRDLCSGRS